MSEELKPCPFCGGEPEMVKRPHRYYVRCMECDQQFEQGLEQEASDAWNRRAEPMPLRPPHPSPDYEVTKMAETVKHEIERLRKALEFYANPEIYKPNPHGPAFDRRDLSFHAKEALENSTPVSSGWRPISEADNGIAYIHHLSEFRIGNSYPIWARDADGRIFECLWADDGKKAYWWDIEGESPVDPVEFMPHPLAPKAEGGAA